MDRYIEIDFSDTNIKKYIKNSENLVIKKKSFEIKKVPFRDTIHRFIVCIDSQEKIDELNKIFDFFIKHKCFFCEYSWSLIYDIDKDLFYKSGYWFLNSEEYFYDYFFVAINYLALAYNDKVVKYIEYAIDNEYSCKIEDIMGLDLGIIDFLVSKCKSGLSKENYDKFIEELINCADRYMDDLITDQGIKFFKCMRRNNILYLLLDNLRKQKYIDHIIYLSIKTNQTEIIDYLLKYGLEKDKVKLNDCEYELLISLIENDNEETFTYTIQNVSISNELIQKMIEGSGEFITKEYVKILLNNGKLDLDNLELLKKSVINNPNKKLKKYVKKINFK